MSSSRENSPDWLRCFQAPAPATVTLSSSSESSPHGSPGSDDYGGIVRGTLSLEEKDAATRKRGDDTDGAQSPPGKASKATYTASKTTPKASKTTPSKAKAKSKSNSLLTYAKKRKMGVNSEDEEKTSNGKVTRPKIDDGPIESINHSIWTLSSDDDSYPDKSKELSPKNTVAFLKEEGREDSIDIGEKPLFKEAPKEKYPKKGLKSHDGMPARECKPIKRGNDTGLELGEEEIIEKPTVPQVSSSSLPLMLSEKVQRCKALVECDGDSIDLSGDVGAVGRIIVSDNPTRNYEMLLDLKGTIYRTAIIPSRTFCVVSFGQSEAKIEAIMNDFIQLKPLSNVYEAETMVEGTLEGFAFGSEDEADNIPKAVTHQADTNEDAKEQINGKTKRRAEKTSGTAGRKSKVAGGKQPKKVKRKSQVSKKTKGNK